MSEKTKLYVITPPHFILTEFLPQVEAAFSGGEIASLQLRMKDASDAEITAAAKVLLPICHRHEAAFILNDRPDIAAHVGADGVHIGQEDLIYWSDDPNPTLRAGPFPEEDEASTASSLKKIRKIIGPEAVLGVTCHASRHLAMLAGEEEADYVAFGAFYPTTSKPKEKLEKWGTPTPDILQWWSEQSTLPCVAIGGITPQNLAPLVQAGADFIAVITGVWNHPAGPAAGVAAYHEAIVKAL